MQVLTEVMPDQIRDRVIEVKKMRLGDIQSHPKNPKYHPADQRELVGNLLTEIGWAGAAIAYHSERADGKLVYIDAHLRKSIAPDFEGQVIITDLNDREADILVALYDESNRKSEIDKVAFDALARGIDTGNALFQKALGDMARRGGMYLQVDPEGIEFGDGDVDPGSFDPDTSGFDPEQDIPPVSAIKQVQLYFSGPEHGDFEKIVEELKGQFGTETISDTVKEAVKFAYNMLTSSNP